MDHVMRVLCGLLFLLLTAPAMAQSPYATAPYSTPGVSNLPAQAASLTVAQPAGSVLAAPTASAGVPSFRVLSATDIANSLGFTPYSATNPSGYQTAANVTATFAAPPALGSTTPAAATFTTATASSDITSGIGGNGRVISDGNMSGSTVGFFGTFMGRNATGGANEGDVLGVNGLCLGGIASSGTIGSANCAISVSAAEAVSIPNITSGTNGLLLGAASGTAAINVNAPAAYGNYLFFLQKNNVSEFFVDNGGNLNALGSGTFGYNVSVTGNISSSGFANRSSLDSQASAGSTQATATALSRQVTRATTCSSGGFILPAGAAVGSSTDIIFLNRSGAACTVYPPTGGTIEAGAANASVSIASGADASFRSMSPSAWYQ